MPRLPRLDLAGIAQHVIQRGNDRQPCFFTPDDYRRYLHDLNEIALREQCAVHAYVLMTNHVHLLVTPGEQGRLSRMMQALGRRYVRHVNRTHHRTGTLREGRYKACLVAGDAHLLRCHRYIELNPLRAAMVPDPRDYPWSSHLHNAFGEHDPLVRPHPVYSAFGAEADERRRRYRAFVMDDVTSEETDAIRAHLQRQHVYGPDRFRLAIEAQLGRSVGPRKIGRPRKSPQDTEVASKRESAL
ncbi:MAG: transposase [Lysobacteraceae bacterium]|nr:MAG: transposase [Xanthomonadaceae bacterium]